MGALNLETMTLVRKDFETINGSATIEFLQTIEKAYSDAKKIHLILDRAGYQVLSQGFLQLKIF